MQRVVSYHDWSQNWWKTRLDRAFNDCPDYREGANAYAYRQASVWRSMKTRCYSLWRVETEVCDAHSADHVFSDRAESLQSPTLAEGESLYHGLGTMCGGISVGDGVS